MKKSDSVVADLKGNCAIVNICEPDRGDESGHFLLPNGVVPSLVPEDLEYLQRKGAFALPEARIRDDLVRTYFRYVHPSLPIVDAQEFLTKYESASLDKIGLHLLWSMYLAASNVGLATPMIHSILALTNPSSQTKMSSREQDTQTGKR